MKSPIFRTSALAPLYDAARLSAMDIGGRGGFDADLSAIAWAVDAVGFEPEPEAFAALEPLGAGPWRSLRWLRTAVGPQSGGATLHVPPDGNGASLLEHDPDIGTRFGLQHLTHDCRAVAVETVTLDDAVARWSVPSPDYLKLDVEGAEYAILAAAPRVVDHAVAVKMEASFIPARRNQPLVADLLNFMAGRGFAVMDLRDPIRWRHRPVAPHPYSWRGEPRYSRGRLAQCDLLFLREPTTIAGDDVATALRAGLLALALGYCDHALEMLGRPAVAEAVQRQHGLAIVPAVMALSRRLGRQAAAAAIRHHLRDLVPLLRSWLGGVPG